MHRISKILIFIGISLIITSTVLFTHNIYEENNAGKNSATVLSAIKEFNIENIENNQNSQIINNETKEEPNTKTINIDGYDYMGIITIPVLNLELPIMAEYDYDRLKIAPCRYYGSIYTNNLIICAHSYKTHFKYIDKLKQKDNIIITSIDGNKYVYEVVEIEILNPNDVSKMIDNDFDLTLYTCTDDGLNRITIRCNQVKNKI